MATVLFLITIPTEAEEVRLKTEFIAKKLEQRAEQQAEAKLTATALTVKFHSSATTPANNIQPPPLAELPELGDYDAETGRTGEGELLTPAKRSPSQQFSASTLTKRRKSDAKPINADNEATPTSALHGSASASSSLRDMEESELLTGGVATTNSRSSAEGMRDVLYSTKRKSQKKKDALPVDLEKPSDASMEVVVREIIKKFQISNAVWTKDAEGRMLQITFTVEFNETYEHLLDKFHAWGFGEREGSTLSVMNCLASKTFSQQEDSVEHGSADDGGDKQGAWNRFMGSVRSRLNVTQVVQNVRQDASITFDFLVLLISAAILAAFGLVEDSTVFLAASMLISPLMGPIIAGIFGTVIQDRQLCALGMKNELIGLLSATLVGFLFGLTVCSIDSRYSIGAGLTNEMLSRCELHSLMVGIFTAIPSGAAAAVGILGGNVGSLIGVAISASLLPPAVNAGLLWALACICKYYENDALYTTVTNTEYYSNNQVTELVLLGTMSMCLTITNIICVYAIGILVLKIKEIAPLAARNNNQFWKRELKIARDLRKGGFDADHALIDEFANLPTEDQRALGIDTDMLRNIHLDEASYQNTWSPVGARHLFDTGYEPMHDNYHTIHPIDRLYSTITRTSGRDSRLRNRFQMGARRHTSRPGEMGMSYKLLSENNTRYDLVPMKTSNAAIVPPSSSTSARSGGATPANARERRKFIVTPAEDTFMRRHNETDA